MAAWFGWLVPIAIAALLGLAATFYLHKIRLPRDERAAGIASLADMRWRVFMKLVLDVLEGRGYARVADGTGMNKEGDCLLEREGERWLLSSGHGTSSLLDTHAFKQFCNDMRMQGAVAGLLVTPGRFAPEVAEQAREHRIQLLDGPTLWPEVRKLLPDAQYASATAPAHARARQQTSLAWLGAAGVALLLGWGLNSHRQAPVVATQPAPSQTTPSPPGAGGRKPPTLQAAPAALGADELASRRREVLKLVSTLPEVDRAVWSTQSTLLVYLVAETSDPVPELCPILEHYEELRTSRLQLQPPQGSHKPVRFLQCRTS